MWIDMCTMAIDACRTMYNVQCTLHAAHAIVHDTPSWKCIFFDDMLCKRRRCLYINVYRWWPHQSCFHTTQWRYQFLSMLQRYAALLPNKYIFIIPHGSPCISRSLEHIYTLYDGLVKPSRQTHQNRTVDTTEDLMFSCPITSIIENALSSWKWKCIFVCVVLSRHIDLFSLECETVIDYLTSPLTGWSSMYYV